MRIPQFSANKIHSVLFPKRKPQHGPYNAIQGHINRRAQFGPSVQSGFGIMDFGCRFAYRIHGTTTIRRSTILQFVTERPKDLVQRCATCAVVALEVSVVQVVVLVRLHVVFPARMGRCRRNQQVDSIPQKHEWRCEEKQGWVNTSVIIQVLYGMHAQARERFNVCISVVQ